MNHGKFVISLDFELMWGVRDKKTKQNYGENIIGVHEAIPKLIKILNKYNINATFAIVGMLFFENKQHLLEHLPSKLPLYENKHLSPYHGHFDTLNADNDPYHFAPLLIQQIQQQPQHEIATHTFSHYYCLEKGQSTEAFRADLQQAIVVAQQHNIKLQSLVFPRNQFNDNYLQLCLELGIICYRGNEESWLYRAQKTDDETYFRRACRLLDAYLNLSGHHCYTDQYLANSLPINIPSSRFLRPFSNKIKLFDQLRLHRILSSMTHAAKNNMTYHLWWHPHNFGVNQKENFHFLEKILQHYQFLHQKYHFSSYTMTDLANFLIKNKSTT